MPIYEYVCKSCGRKTEVIARFGESPPRICSHCGGRLKKAFSAPAIQFKGTGWYVTDYARAGNGEKGEKGEAATEKGEAATEKETSSEEKPAEKKKQAGEKKEAGEKKREAGEKKASKKE
jgi:putative FmdB family regulatory protein